jgi:hypothetical protein
VCCSPKLMNYQTLLCIPPTDFQQRRTLLCSVSIRFSLLTYLPLLFKTHFNISTRINANICHILLVNISPAPTTCKPIIKNNIYQTEHRYQTAYYQRCPTTNHRRLSSIEFSSLHCNLKGRRNERINLDDVNMTDRHLVANFVVKKHQEERRLFLQSNEGTPSDVCCTYCRLVVARLRWNLLNWNNLLIKNGKQNLRLDIWSFVTPVLYCIYVLKRYHGIYVLRFIL